MARIEDSATKPLTTEGLTGPADTADASVMVSTTAPRPGDTARKVGTVVGISVIPAAQVAVDDPSLDRYEIYEVTGPDGRPQWMRRNMENGATEKVGPEVALEDREARARKAGGEAVQAARAKGAAVDIEAQRVARAARAAAAELERLVAASDPAGA